MNWLFKIQFMYNVYGNICEFILWIYTFNVYSKVNPHFGVSTHEMRNWRESFVPETVNREFSKLHLIFSFILK